MKPPILTESNYKIGFLVDEEWIGGITEAEGLYCAYASHYLTGETFVYEEFSTLSDALNYMNQVERNWKFEGVGCSSKSTSPTASGCGNCGTKCS